MSKLGCRNILKAVVCKLKMYGPSNSACQNKVKGCYLQFGNSFFDLGNVVSALDDKFDHKSVG